MFLPLAESLLLYSHPALLRQTHVCEGISSSDNLREFTKLDYLYSKTQKEFQCAGHRAVIGVASIGLHMENQQSELNPHSS